MQQYKLQLPFNLEAQLELSTCRVIHDPRGIDKEKLFSLSKPEPNSKSEGSSSRNLIRIRHTSIQKQTQKPQNKRKLIQI